ncbi:GTPase IMAP family member 9-like [Onychostoma macrolepis]|uniref:GTPase IMAP family member 9-like n=1 Tax=Onychostoma macrolepis TaxID=369639 RepID=UPI00272CD719|nr:GTPase IMAP family member 9-like [Onychostoma macrolepis]
MRSVTSECSAAHASVSRRSVYAVDTPGFTYLNAEESMTEIGRSVYLSSPGPHAFLIVFALNMRCTGMWQLIPDDIESLFGEKVLKYSIILFTHGDLLEEDPIEELIEENYVVRCAVQQCGGRFHVYNNRDENNREQVNDLLQKIDSMIEQNGGGHYSNLMFQDAQIFGYTII